jgi:hypothetical protein
VGGFKTALLRLSCSRQNILGILSHVIEFRLVFVAYEKNMLKQLCDVASNKRYIVCSVDGETAESVFVNAGITTIVVTSMCFDLDSVGMMLSCLDV